MSEQQGDGEEDRAWALALARAFLAPQEPEPRPEPGDAEALLRGDAERVWTVAPLRAPADEGAGAQQCAEEQHGDDSPS